MYINPIVVGVVGTLLVELIVVLGLAITFYKKEDK